MDTEQNLQLVGLTTWKMAALHGNVQLLPFTNLIYTVSLGTIFLSLSTVTAAPKVNSNLAEAMTDSLCIQLSMLKAKMLGI